MHTLVLVVLVSTAIAEAAEGLVHQQLGLDRYACAHFLETTATV